MIAGEYGIIIFGRNGGAIHTFYEIERKYKGRYGAHMVHLRKPLLEWAGNDLIEITMKLCLNTAWCGDIDALLARWHFFHENGLFAPLIIGGKPMGPGLSCFVITELTETHKNWMPSGQVLACELAATFQEYIPFSEGVLSSLGVPGFPGSSLLGSGAI